jgi:DNA-binding response OmpR family regulator
MADGTGRIVTTRIVVVEDEFLIGLDISQQLSAAGFEVVALATSVDKARHLLARETFDVAILDINLGGETAEPVACDLRAAGKPFILLTGYSAEKTFPWSRGAAVLTKPPRIADLIAAIRAVAPPAPAPAPQ